MALINKGGCECLLSSLELFAVPSTQASIVGGVLKRYFPLVSLDRGPIELRVNSSEFEYLDLIHTYLYTKSRILDGDGRPIPSKAGAGEDATFNHDGVVLPINYFHSTRFKSLEVYLNNQQVNETDSMYAYKSYIEYLLSYNRGAKDNAGRMVLWAKDKNPDGNFIQMDEETEDDLSELANHGGWCRWQNTKFSSSFETMGKIHSELLCQDRMLPSNCELRLRFHRADPSFALMAKNSRKDFSIVIDSAVLFVRHVEVASSIREAHAKAALHSNYKFPIRKTRSLFFTYSSGRQDLSCHNLVTGKLPRRVVLGFLKSSSFHGDLSSSPFTFSNFNITNLIVRVNGQSLPMENGMEFDFPRGNYLQGYWSLLQGTSNLFSNNDIDINPWVEYSNDTCLFAFDLSPEMESGNTNHFDLIREGNVDVEVKLGQVAPCSITMIAHLEFDHIIEMTKDGDVVSEP